MTCPNQPIRPSWRFSQIGATPKIVLNRGFYSRKAFRPKSAASAVLQKQPQTYVIKPHVQFGQSRWFIFI